MNDEQWWRLKFATLFGLAPNYTRQSQPSVYYNPITDRATTIRSVRPGWVGWLVGWSRDITCACMIKAGTVTRPSSFAHFPPLPRPLSIGPRSELNHLLCATFQNVLLADATEQQQQRYLAEPLLLAMWCCRRTNERLLYNVAWMGSHAKTWTPIICNIDRMLPRSNGAYNWLPCRCCWSNGVAKFLLQGVGRQYPPSPSPCSPSQLVHPSMGR